MSWKQLDQVFCILHYSVFNTQEQTCDLTAQIWSHMMRPVLW